MATREFERESTPARPLSYWETAINNGMDVGKNLFYDHPDMQNLRARREDLSHGYSGQEMGALRESARREVQGQRQGYLNQLNSRMSRQGVGGARRAAAVGAADNRYAQTTADNERKMALDSAQLKRQGVTDLQDYLFRQRYGQLGTGIGYGQMAVGENTANAMRAAAGGGGGGNDDFGRAWNAYMDGVMPWRLLDDEGIGGKEGVGVKGNIGGWEYSF